MKRVNVEKKMLFVVICVVFMLSCCNKTKDEDIPKNKLVVVDLQGEGLGYNWFITNKSLDVAIKVDSENKLDVATIRNSSKGDIVHIFFDKKGYPIKYVIDKDIILVGNIRGNTADIVHVDEGNELNVYRDCQMSWDSTFYQTWNKSSISRSAVDWDRFGKVLWEDNLRWIGIGVAYGIKSIPDFAALLGPSDVKSKATAIIGIANNLADAVLEAFPDEKAEINAGQIEDILGELDDWRSIGENWAELPDGYKITAFGEYLQNKFFNVLGGTLADMLRPEKKETLELGSYVLTCGYGAIQITLRWDSINDIDLHVVDPYGEEIYFAHKTSASGGYLDYDNIYGYGPENVFWKSTGSTGTYNVFVNHYSGSTNAQYTVFINAFDKTRTIPGVISPHQKKHVASFDNYGISIFNQTVLSTRVRESKTK